MSYTIYANPTENATKNVFNFFINVRKKANGFTFCLAHLRCAVCWALMFAEVITFCYMQSVFQKITVLSVGTVVIEATVEVIFPFLSSYIK